MLREAADIGGALSGRPRAWHAAETTAVFYFGLGVRWAGWPCLARHLKPPTVSSALIAAQGPAVPSAWPLSQPCWPLSPPVLRLVLLLPAESALNQSPTTAGVLFMETQEMSLVASENHCLWLDLVRTQAYCKQP